MESEWHYKSTKPPSRQEELPAGGIKTKSILKQSSAFSTPSYYDSGYLTSGPSFGGQSEIPKTPKIVITGSVLNGNRSKIIVPVNELSAPLTKSKGDLETLKSTITAVTSGEECFRPKKKKCHEKTDRKKSCEEKKSSKSQRSVHAPISVLSTGPRVQRKSIVSETPLNTEGANSITRSPVVSKYLSQTQTVPKQVHVAESVSKQVVESVPKIKSSLWSHSGNFYETGSPTSAPEEEPPQPQETRTIALQSQPYYASVAQLPTKPPPPCPCCNYHRGIIKNLKENQKALEEQLRTAIVPEEEQPIATRSGVSQLTGRMSTAYPNVVSEVLEVIEESPVDQQEVEPEVQASSRTGPKSSKGLEQSNISTKYQSTRSNIGQETSELDQEPSSSTRYKSTRSNIGQESSGVGPESSVSTKYKSTRSAIGQESSGVGPESSVSTKYKSTRSGIGQESSGVGPESSVSTKYKSTRSAIGQDSSGVGPESSVSTKYKSTRSGIGQESSGVGPESSVSTKYKSTRSAIGQKSSGVGPESSVSTKYKSTRSAIGQKSSGVGPESSVSTKYKSTRSGIGQEPSGMDQESSATTKYKSTRSALGQESSRAVGEESSSMKYESLQTQPGVESPATDTDEETPSRCFSRTNKKKFESQPKQYSDEQTVSPDTEDEAPSRCFSRTNKKKFESQPEQYSNEQAGSPDTEDEAPSRCFSRTKKTNQPHSLKKMSRYLSISPGENDEFIMAKMREAMPSSTEGRTDSFTEEAPQTEEEFFEELFEDAELERKVSRSVQVPSRLRGRPLPREGQVGTIIVSQRVKHATVLHTPESEPIVNMERSSIHSSRGSGQSFDPMVVQLQDRPSLIRNNYFAFRGTPQPPPPKWGPEVCDFQPQRKAPKQFDFFEPAPDYLYDIQETAESVAVSQQEPVQSLPGDSQLFIPGDYQQELLPEPVPVCCSTPTLSPDGRPILNLETLRLPGSPSFRQPLPSPIFPSSNRLPRPQQQQFPETPTDIPKTTITTPEGQALSIASPSKHTMNVASKISNMAQSKQNINDMRFYERESLAKLPPKPTPSQYPADPTEAPCPCCDYYGIEDEEKSRKRSRASQQAQNLSLSVSKIQTKSISVISKTEARELIEERKQREIDALWAQVPEEVEEVIEEIEEEPETPPPKGFLCCTKPQKKFSEPFERSKEETPTSDSQKAPQSEQSTTLQSSSNVRSRSQSQSKMNRSSSVQEEQEPQSQSDAQVQESGYTEESASPTETKKTSSSSSKMRTDAVESSGDDVQSQKSGKPSKSGSKFRFKGGVCCTKRQQRESEPFGLTEDGTPTSDSPDTDNVESGSKHSSRSRTNSIAKSRNSAGSIKSNLSKRSGRLSGDGEVGGDVDGGGEDVPQEGEAVVDFLDSEAEIAGSDEEQEPEEEEDYYEEEAEEEVEEEPEEEEYSEVTEEPVVKYTTSAPDLSELVEEEEGEEEEEETPEEGGDNVEESDEFLCSMAPVGKTPSIFIRLHDDYEPPPPPTEKIILHPTTSDPDFIIKDEYKPCQCKAVSLYKPRKPTHWSLLKRYSDDPELKPREIYFEAIERKKLPSSILPPFNPSKLTKVPPLRKPPKGFRGLACTFELIACTEQILSITQFPPNQLARADKKSFLMDDVYNDKTPLLAIKNWDDTPDSDMIDKDAPPDHPKNYLYWLQCGICLTHPFAGSVIRILDCLHSFCSDCVEKYLFPTPMNPALNHQIMCPVCKELTTVPANKGIHGIQRAFYLERMRELYYQLEKLELPSCENAAAFTLDGGGEHGMSTHHCLDCFKSFCTPCFYKHVREMDHSGMRYQDAKAKLLKRQLPAVKQICLLHDNAPIKYWCNNDECHIASCEQCSVEAHWKKACHQRIALSVHYPRILKKIDSYLNDIFPKSFKKIDDTSSMLKKHFDVMTKKAQTFQAYLLRRNNRAKEIVETLVLRCKYQCDVLKKTMLATVDKEIEDQEKLRKRLKKYYRIINIVSCIATNEEITPLCKRVALTATAYMQSAIKPCSYNRTVQIYCDKPVEVSFNVFMKRKPLMRRFEALQKSVECLALKDDILIAIHHSTMGRYPSSVVLIGTDWESIDDWIELFKYNAPNVVSVAVVDIDGVRMIAAVNRNDYMCKITTLKEKELKMVNLNDEPNNNGAGAHSICLLDTNYSKDAQRVFKSESFSPRCVTDTPLGGFLCSDEEAMDGNCTRISRWYNENLPPKPVHEPIYFNEQLRIGRAEYMVTNMSNGDIFINDTKATNIILMDKKGVIKNVIESGLEIDDPLSPLIPKGMYFDQNMKQLYVAYPYANEIARFDANGNSKEIFLNEHDQVSGPMTLLIDPREDCLVVGSLDGSISYFTLFPDSFY